MGNYTLSIAAEQDIRQIISYTVEEWGKEQAQKYVRALEECFADIVKGEAVERRFSRRIPGCLYLRCVQHYIFYLNPDKSNPVIIAILHQRMNFIARLKGRLK